MATWDKQPGEPGRWYSRFWGYCLLGHNRTLQLAWSNDWDATQKRRKTPTGKHKPAQPPKSWYQMRQRYSWDQRAEEYDVEQDRLRAAQMATEFAEMNKRHVQGAVLAQNIALLALNDLVTQVQQRGSNISLDAAVRVLTQAGMLERMARSVPDTASAAKQQAEAAGRKIGLTDEERAARLERLLAARPTAPPGAPTPAKPGSNGSGSLNGSNGKH